MPEPADYFQRVRVVSDGTIINTHVTTVADDRPLMVTRLQWTCDVNATAMGGPPLELWVYRPDLDLTMDARLHAVTPVRETLLRQLQQDRHLEDCAIYSGGPAEDCDCGWYELQGHLRALLRSEDAPDAP